MADRCCENCGWSETVGSPIMCNYNGHRTWRDECCEAWKPKEEEMNMVKVVRCKDCKHYRPGRLIECGLHNACQPNPDFYCADGEPKDGEQ